MAKKYAGVYPPLIERLLTEEGHKKDPDKAVKTKLHQIYGAYIQANAYKKSAAILKSLVEYDFPGGHPTGNPNNLMAEMERAHYGRLATVNTLLALHASTNERLPYYFDFYDFILRQTGQVASIMDIGCGYNPFSLPYIEAVWAHITKAHCSKSDPPDPRIDLEAYYAYDIDTRVADLINRFFYEMDLPQYAKCADLVEYIPPEQADIALMLKLLPVLEAQSPGSGFRLARELNARYLVITYPLKSLGGREKGMEQHYSAIFEKALADGELGKFTPVSQQQIGPEMLYLLETANI